MTLQDFDKEGYFNHYISKERFWFENKKVGFWYRIYLTSHTYQPDWGGDFCCHWWLRSPNYDSKNIAYRVYCGGGFGRDGEVKETIYGVRPACWIKL